MKGPGTGSARLTASALRRPPSRAILVALGVLVLASCEHGSTYLLETKVELREGGVWAPESDAIRITIKDAILFGNLLMVSPAVLNTGKDEIQLKESYCMVGEVRAPVAGKLNASTTPVKPAAANAGPKVAVNRETRLYLSYRLEKISPPIPDRVVVHLDWEMKGHPIHQEISLKLATP
jgi:hypothetical protein